jgi:ANTAR domain/GAF domain
MRVVDTNRQAPDAGVGSDERMRRADLWEAGADERERLADEREALADEREALADERERLADRQEHGQDRREADQLAQAWANDKVDIAAEAAATQAALRHAEAGVQRAEAELERKRHAAARARDHAARHTAGSERATAAAQEAAATVDAQEGGWLADRRDFVAVERDHQADERDETADRREETAGLRDHLADQRERELLERERRLDQPRPLGRRARAARLPARREPTTDQGVRADGERQRKRAAAGRRAAAHDRALAAATWGPQAYGPRLLASFAPLARQLFSDQDMPDVLVQVVKFTVDAVAGCDCASITLYRHGHIIDTVANDPVAAELDDIQFATGIGPGTEAMQGDNPVYMADLTDSPRWPVFAATAAQLGVASALCHGLFVHRPAQWSALGALNLYGTTPDAFSDEDQEFASILAAYVSVTVAMAQRRDEVDRREAALHRALSTRDVIGQAKGILMERQHLSAGDAFDLLRRASRRLNRKLADVANHLAETGEIPT